MSSNRIKIIIIVGRITSSTFNRRREKGRKMLREEELGDRCLKNSNNFPYKLVRN